MHPSKNFKFCDILQKILNFVSLRKIIFRELLRINEIKVVVFVGEFGDVFVFFILKYIGNPDYEKVIFLVIN